MKSFYSAAPIDWAKVNLCLIFFTPQLVNNLHRYSCPLLTTQQTFIRLITPQIFIWVTTQPTSYFFSWLCNNLVWKYLPTSSKIQFKFINLFIYLIIFIKLSTRAGFDTRSDFKWQSTGSKWVIPCPWLMVITGFKSPVFPNTDKQLKGGIELGSQGPSIIVCITRRMA